MFFTRVSTAKHTECKHSGRLVFKEAAERLQNIRGSICMHNATKSEMVVGTD